MSCRNCTCPDCQATWKDAVPGFWKTVKGVWGPRYEFAVNIYSRWAPCGVGCFGLVTTTKYGTFDVVAGDSCELHLLGVKSLPEARTIVEKLWQDQNPQYKDHLLVLEYGTGATLT